MQFAVYLGKTLQRMVDDELDFAFFHFPVKHLGAVLVHRRQRQQAGQGLDNGDFGSQR